VAASHEKCLLGEMAHGGLSRIKRLLTLTNLGKISRFKVSFPINLSWMNFFIVRDADPLGPIICGYGDLTGISVCDTWPHFAADKRILWLFDSFFTLH